MSEILKVTKENVLKTAKLCKEWEEALEILFPSVFEKKAVKEMVEEISGYVDYDNNLVLSGLQSFAGSGVNTYCGNGNIRARKYNEGFFRVHVHRNALTKSGNFSFGKVTLTFAENLMKVLGVEKHETSVLYDKMIKNEYWYGSKLFLVRKEDGYIHFAIKNDEVREREEYVAFEVTSEIMGALYKGYSC